MEHEVYLFQYVYNVYTVQFQVGSDVNAISQPLCMHAGASRLRVYTLRD